MGESVFVGVSIDHYNVVTFPQIGCFFSSFDIRIIFKLLLWFCCAEDIVGSFAIESMYRCGKTFSNENCGLGFLQ